MNKRTKKYNYVKRENVAIATISRSFSAPPFTFHAPPFLHALSQVHLSTFSFLFPLLKIYRGLENEW